MGGLFSGEAILQQDLRPMLRVRIVRLVQASISDDSDGELDAYVQVTYGDLKPKKTKKGSKTAVSDIADGVKRLLSKEKDDNDDNDNDNENNNDDSDDNDKNKDKVFADHYDKERDGNGFDNDSKDFSKESLSIGKPGTTTHKTDVKETSGHSIYFNETFYFPVAAINTRKSLEISLWDKDIGPQITDDYFGKAIIYYSKYNESDQVLSNPSKKANYLLPNELNKIVNYSIDITDHSNANKSNNNNNNKDNNDNHKFTTGTLEIELEFQDRKHYHFDDDGNIDNMNEIENDNATKRNNTRHNRYENPESTTCVVCRVGAPGVL